MADMTANKDEIEKQIEELLENLVFHATFICSRCGNEELMHFHKDAAKPKRRWDLDFDHDMAFICPNCSDVIKKEEKCLNCAFNGDSKCTAGILRCDPKPKPGYFI